jgi:hypothetical protein
MNPVNEMRLEIDGIIYVVSTHYADDAQETVTDKIARLVRGDEKIVEKAAL